MQFIANGPEIPDALLHAHEEGRVVFFCGAGISRSAGLPGFQGLVDEIYHLVGTTPNDTEKEAYVRNQFDTTLDLLERRIPGQRLTVRNALAKALEPNLRRKGAKDTHDALLQLARNREGSLRLVTTNYDRIFEQRRAHAKPAVPTYSAPLLPIPKNSRWNGLVYLHGLLPKNHDTNALNQLVLTSGDFGLAYLTERWAARFVSELFRNYVVCFVGYSINDPVMRYIMDALAADRMLGEEAPIAYAFGDCTPGDESSKTTEWEAKVVEPILYYVPVGSRDHSALNRTLKAWAEIHRDGILGKERIVVDYAMARPSASTRQDDFVGRMLWALSDKTGLPAKRFADFDPVPPLDWLEAFAENRYRHDDLSRFGVQKNAAADNELRFSLVRRPAPYTHTSWMTLVSGGAADSQWDYVMDHISRWLVRHLDDPTLVLWLAQHGGQLHDRFSRRIDGKLDEIFRLEQEGKNDELARIQAQAPNAIPRPLMRKIWRLFLTDRVKSSMRDLDIYSWIDQLKRDELTSSMRLKLRELLAPKIEIKRPFHLVEKDKGTSDPEHLKQLVDWELVLTVDHVHSMLRQLATIEQWREAMPTLLNDFQQLLCDALDLLRELGAADDRSDRSYWDLPSISPHRQNHGFHDWVALIELLRDAWLTIREKDPARATCIAQKWSTVSYPTFKRLALFAASHDGCIAPDQWVDWLLADDSWWLWSITTIRETLRLFRLQGPNLTPEALGRLEAAISIGPPRAMFQDDIEAEDWLDLVDRSIWLRLSKLESCGVKVGQAAVERLKVLSAAHPAWKLSPYQIEEFSHWTSVTGDPDFKDMHKVEQVPSKQADLVAWLKGTRPSQGPFREDNWREYCEKRASDCADALGNLAREGIWPADRWREALQVWSGETHVKGSWQCIAPLIRTIPDEVLVDILHSISWWLEAVSKTLGCPEASFLALCRRILDIQYQEEEDEKDEPVFQAINHPIGRITTALLNLWFKRSPSDGDLLPDWLRPIFTRLSDTNIAKFRHARVVLASRLVALFRVDRPWAVDHLLPLLDWTINAQEAQSSWKGFLWSPRLYPPLQIEFRKHFLDTGNHYSALGDYGPQFAALLTYAALYQIDTYTPQEFQTAFGALPQDGLEESARTLFQALEAAGKKSEDFWDNRVLPLWKNIWPKSLSLVSESMAESLARLAIAAGGRFSAAFTSVLGWLKPIKHPHFVVEKLHESGLSKLFPEDALALLNAIIDNHSWPPRELDQCLHDISQADTSLKDDPRYRRLKEYFRKRPN